VLTGEWRIGIDEDKGLCGRTLSEIKERPRVSGLILVLLMSLLETLE